jgi:hypothetical protein
MWDNIFETMSQTIIYFFRSMIKNDIFDKEPFVKINDPTSDCPMLITSITPIIIRTCVENSNLWCQFYYQFGHEITHYIFRQHKKNKNIIIKWFEETVCEAMALYIMNNIGQHWTGNALYQINSEYHISIFNYINKEMAKIGTDKLRGCNTINQLIEVEKTSEENRADRYFERSYLYQKFIELPEKIHTIFYYTDFIQQDDLLIDFDKWMVVFSDVKDFIETIKIIQPIINN